MIDPPSVPDDGEIVQGGSVPAKDTQAPASLVDAAASVIHDRVEDIEDGDKKREFLDALEAMEKNEGPLKTIMELLKDGAKIERIPLASATSTLLDLFSQQLGKIEEGEKIVGYNIDFLRNFENLISKCIAYFGDLMPAAWQEKIYTRIAEDCLLLAHLSDYREFDQHPPVWRAKDLSEEIQLAERIHKRFPVKDFEARKQKMIGHIKFILHQNISLDFFDPSKNDRDRDQIKALAGQWGIDLPSEQDIAQREIAEQLERLESNLQVVEQKQAAGSAFHATEINELRRQVEERSQLVFGLSKKFPRHANTYIR